MSWLTLLLSAAGAGCVAVLVTLAIERWGGRVGGLIGTLPSTIVPASLGVFASTGEAGFEAAMWTVPPGMLVNALFLWVWRVVPRRLPPGWALGPRLLVMTGLSLLAWAAAASGLAVGLSQLSAAQLPWAGGAGLCALAGFGLWSTRRPGLAPAGRKPVPAAVLVLRGLGAGTAVGVAVWLSTRDLGLWAGVASVFPAIFLTTMVSLWLSQGEAVPAGAVGPMMLGSTSVAGYALFSVWLYPALGLPGGAFAAWGLAALLCTLPAAGWLRRG